jgi:hypothetical protein
MKSEISYRSRNIYQKALKYGLTPQTSVNYRTMTFKDFPDLRKAGDDPYVILNTLLLNSETASSDLIEALRAIGAGSSSWIQLAKYLMRKEILAKGKMI